MKRINFNNANLTKLRLPICLLGLLLWSAVSAVGQGQADTAGKINPSVNCGGNDLCVEWARDDAARGEYRSEFFYVVVLKTTDKCRATEKERLKFQVLFPKNKVFLEEFACDDDSEKRNSYSGIGDGEHSFIAAYAGRTKTEAEKFLQTVKATKKFSGANVRRTQVIVAGT